MKKIILSLALATLLISCKEETKEKLEDAGKAVTSDIKANIDTVKAKAKSKIDSAEIKAKSKIDSAAIKAKSDLKSAKLKGADLLEKGAKKLKD
jgi:PBP1b-binding outer membrane lipoprotein LpoB